MAKEAMMPLDAEIRGVFIEKMVANGREVILGMKKDAQFGPMLMFGLGGIFVEILKDVIFSLAPVTADEDRPGRRQALIAVRGQDQCRDGRHRFGRLRRRQA